MRLTIVLPLALLGLVSGCNGGVRELPSPAHKGTTIALPGGRGFFELGTDTDQKVERGTRAKLPKTSIVVYFYQSDGTTEMNPAPTEVTVKVGTGASSPDVPLALQEKPVGQFKSAPGNFPSGFRGQLNAKINGETVETTFVLR
jgi:hypothetical protein